LKAGEKVYFVLALHNHQPVGNLPHVFEENFKIAYEPFVEVLERFPNIKVGMHYTGSLLEWIEENRPDFIDRLRGLVARGQVEILGGAYYEPILPIIPDEDKIEQIRFMSQRLEELLGTRPRGMWLAERIWEPHLPRPIATAGMEYLPIDDAHFEAMGYKDLDHYYRTEEEGWPLDIFPINEQLRYLIPFKPPEESINFFREKQDRRRPRLFVLADDGEKFGGWPGTYKAVYEKGWLERFFSLLEENREWLETVTFSEYRSLFKPRGPVYLPAGSYREMKEWSQGFWRNFLTRYPESNRMHKKMLALRRRLDQLKGGEQYQQARRLIWAGQCNCAYWHGVFGGLYLNFLRSAVWEKLLQAERLIDSVLEGEPFVRVETEDRSYSGQEEIQLSSDRFTLLLSPHLGGSLWELSWRPGAVNLLATLTRRPEAYHQKLMEQTASPAPPEDQVASIHHLQAVKEEGLLEHLHYDPYPRGGLIDHFLDKEMTLEEFRKGHYREVGGFLLRPAEYAIQNGGSPGGAGEVKLIFRREGELEENVRLLLEKSVVLRAGEDRISVAYLIENRGRERAEACFAVEMNLAFLAGYDDCCYYEIPGRRLEERHLASMGAEESVEELIMVDGWRRFKLTLRFDRPAVFWRAPIETVSQSEGGMERVYQQSLLLFRWDLLLDRGGREELGITMAFESLAEKGAEQESAKEEVRG